jgi:hypothetical protein
MPISDLAESIEAQGLRHLKSQQKVVAFEKSL